MSNIKQELHNLVLAYKKHSGLVQDLSSKAYEKLISYCRVAAKQGKTSISNLPIFFEGCYGGNRELVDEVAKEVKEKLLKNELTAIVNLDGDGYPQITIYW